MAKLILWVRPFKTKYILKPCLGEWTPSVFPEVLKTLKKTRQTAENKQTFDLTGKLKLREKLVKTLKINKLLVLS